MEIWAAPHAVPGHAGPVRPSAARPQGLRHLTPWALAAAVPAVRGRVARRFREARRRHGAEADLDWSKLSEAMQSKPPVGNGKSTLKVTGWSGVRPIRTTGKLRLGCLTCLRPRGKPSKAWFGHFGDPKTPFGEGFESEAKEFRAGERPPCSRSQ